MDPRLAQDICCPRCRSALEPTQPFRCVNAVCDYATEGFPTVAGKPALIDFSDSIIDKDALGHASGASPLARSSGFLRRLRERALGRNKVAAPNCAVFLERIRGLSAPSVLVIGGGTRGVGTRPIYAAPDVRVVGTDIYASDAIDLLADGHRLPFKDASFHGVWIQAVLEHVVSPEVVVAEIHRILADGGIVYAETPFLQPVHERAYDFTRFTRSGHRWLFRHFREVGSGTIGGPAESLLWGIRYLGRSLFRSEKVGSLFAVLFFWLRYLDTFVDDAYRADVATGVYFLGTKSDDVMAPRDLVAYFPGVRGK